MSEFDLAVFWSVFAEMLGVWLYVIIAVAVATTIFFVRALLQEHGLDFRRFVMSQALGLAGGLAALFFMWWITNSSIFDVGGPIDALLVLGIYLVGWAGATMLFYATSGLLRRRPAATTAEVAPMRSTRAA
jgi:hypothetical protein